MSFIPKLTSVDLKEIIKKYKVQINQDNNASEIYKWELVAQAQEKWDMEAEDFAGMLTSLDFENLVYPMARAVIFHIAQEKPEELRRAFQDLFDEAVELGTRMKQFKKTTRQLYDSIEGGKHKKDGTHQDERTIATYLTFYYPDKYTFYKHSYYKKLKSELTRRKFPGNYLHYLEIVNAFKKHFISQDNELLELKKSFLSHSNNAYPDPEHNILAQDIIYTVMDKNFEAFETTKTIQEIPRHFPHNIILYGPPGTGKTYSTKAYAVSLAENAAPSDQTRLNENENREECLQKFEVLKADGRVEFVTFHQSFSYEDFVQGIRPDVTKEKLAFDRVDGVFKVICDRARRNFENSTTENPSTGISFEDVFNTFMSDLVQEEVSEIQVPMRSKGYGFSITSYDPDEGRIKFRKQSGGTSHDLLKKNLKAIYEGQLDYGIDGLGVYYYPLVDRLKEFAEEKQEESPKEELKHYVLVIDEINRANVSRVLGELITLLEPDKRLGAKDELKVRLPSGEDFAVPPNLHIIGTMNTADKSIAHLDVALRRRFQFVPVYPNSSLVTDPQKKAVLEKLNKAIVAEGNPDLTIGHSYFMNGESLEEIMDQKVIPLLMEYFSHQSDQVAKILNSAGVATVQNGFGLLTCKGYLADGQE